MSKKIWPKPKRKPQRETKTNKPAKAHSVVVPLDVDKRCTRRTRSQKHPIAPRRDNQSAKIARCYHLITPLIYSTALQQESDGTEDGSQTGASASSGVDGTGVEDRHGGRGGARSGASSAGGLSVGDQRSGSNAGNDGDDGHAAAANLGNGGGAWIRVRCGHLYMNRELLTSSGTWSR
jgi:hypothetical protein